MGRLRVVSEWTNAGIRRGHRLGGSAGTSILPRELNIILRSRGVFFNSLQDRHATRRSTPLIDAKQNWCLVRGAESNGFTTLAFTRDFISCDDTDMNIEVCVIAVLSHNSHKICIFIGTS